MSKFLKRLRLIGDQFRRLELRLRLRKFPSMILRNSNCVFVLDPGLKFAGGHHLASARTLSSEARYLGHDVIVVGHMGAGPEALSLGVVPYFTSTGYEAGPSNLSVDLDDAEATGAVRLAWANSCFLQDLLAIPRSWFKRNDFILFPSVTLNQMLAICQWISGFSAAKSPRFAICLMFEPDIGSWGSLGDIGTAYVVSSVALLNKAQRQRVIVTCENRKLAEIYGPLVGSEPVVLPAPLHFMSGTDHLPPASITSPSGGIPLIACVGFVTEAKGFHLLPEIIAHVRESHQTVSFVIHMTGGSSKFTTKIRREILESDSTSRVICEYLDEIELVELIKSADLLLLPYDPKVYHLRSSGLLNEALNFGIPLVVPANTAIAEEASAGGGCIQFEHYDSKSIAAAILDALNHLEPLTQAARVRANKNSNNRRGYLETLMNSF